MCGLCESGQEAGLSEAVVCLSKIEQKVSVYRFAAPARKGPLVSVPWLSEGSEVKLRVDDEADKSNKKKEE